MSDFVSKTDLVSWSNAQFRDEDVITTAEIPDEVVEGANVKVVAELIRRKISPDEVPDESDDFKMLKYAALAFALALLAKARVITETTGQVLKEAFGEVSYQFAKMNPLFFFATGASKSFQDLLPQETFRMMFYSFIRAYEEYYFFQQQGTMLPTPKVVLDQTSRGAYWNENIDDITSSDKAYGEYKDEDELRYHS